MSLLKRLDKDIITALKSKDSFSLIVLRGLKSDIKYKQIDKGDDLTEEEVILVLSSAAKKRRDSIEQFRNGGREDLVKQETSELKIIKNYLPEQLSEDKLRELAAESIRASGVESPSQIGLVMKDLMPKVKGKADGKLVSRIVGELLSKK